MRVQYTLTIVAVVALQRGWAIFITYWIRTSSPFTALEILLAQSPRPSMISSTRGDSPALLKVFRIRRVGSRSPWRARGSAYVMFVESLFLLLVSKGGVELCECATGLPIFSSFVHTCRLIHGSSTSSDTSAFVSYLDSLFFTNTQ